MAAQTQVRTIIVKADTKGNQQLRQMAKDLGMLNQNVSSISKSMNIFSKLAGFTFLGLGIRQLTDMSDSVQTLRDRLKILTGSAESANQVFNQLQAVAFRTKTSTADLATIYTRMGAATKDLGVSTSQLVRFTEILQNTFRLSGSSATEATAAAIQMSQGFASGQLRGQELRSVLEANVYIGQILADTFGVTRGELYKLAEAGQLTADRVFMALLKNGGKVNEEASKLSQTFNQSLTVAMDRVAVKIAELNKSLGLSEGLASVLNWLIENGDRVIVKLLGIATAIAAIKIAAIATTINVGKMKEIFIALYNVIMKAAVAILTLAQAHPMIAAITAAVVALGAAMTLLDKETLIDIWEGFRNALGLAIKAIGTFYAAFLSIFELFTGPGSIYPHLKKMVDGLSDYVSVSNQASRATRDLYRNVNESMAEIPFYNREFQKLNELGWMTPSIKKADETINASKITDKKPEKELKKYKTINDAFNAGEISVYKYAEALRQADIAFAQSKFANGEISLFERNEKQNEAALSRFNQQLSLGVISVQEYNDAVNNLQASELKEKLDAGVISLKEYESTLVSISDKLGTDGAFRVGIRNYLDSIGTLSSDIAKSVENAFGTLEDALFQFTMKGKRDFSDMAQSILDDISRIILRAAILRPLAGGLDTLMTSWLTAGDGGAGNGGGLAGAGPGQTLMPMAKGGIIDNPTFLGYSKGRAALGGEAGPEAVLPLSRGANGNLGVSASVTPVTINVINNAGVGIEQQETVGADGSKTLDLIITNKIKEGISTGSFDRVFSSTYGLKRRGV